MKGFLSFLLIYTSIVEAMTFRETTRDGNISARENFTKNCDLHRSQKDAGDKVVLSRKRRYLTFPDGSAFVATVSMVKTLQYQQTTPFNFVIEYDVIWPIPGNKSPDDDDDDDDDADNRIYIKRISRPSRWRVHRRHKRDLYANYEAALNSQNLPGKNCVLRTICEARSVLEPPGVSFIEDLLRIIFSNSGVSGEKMDAYDRAYVTRKDCDIKYPCPFSIIELILSFDQELIT